MLRIDKNVHVNPDWTDGIFDKILKVDNKILEAAKNFEKEYIVVWKDENKLNYSELWKEQDLRPRPQQLDWDHQLPLVKMVK